MISTFSRLAQAGAERLWRGGFTALARLAPRRLASECPGDDVPVVALAPHPDDEAAGAAGTLLRHRRAGASVTVVCVTDGRLSRALGLDAEAMAARRQAEARRAAELLGARLEWMDLPEGGWERAGLEPRLEELLRRLEPRLLYAPSLVDYHPEHVKVALALGAVLSRLPSAPAVRVYETQVPLTAALANRAVDVSAVRAEADAVLEAYTSQQGSLRRLSRQRRYAASRHGLRGEVEVFWELSAAGYARLHAQQAPRGSFRGTRPRSFSDPLAYLAGSAERRRLRAMAADAR